jgi:hypothetical protein
MKIYLSALGWVPDEPEGNRLRWVFPVEVVDDLSYSGLPETIIIERAPLDEDLPRPSLTTAPSVNYIPNVPQSWWDTLGNVQPSSFLLPKKYTFPKSVQGIQFTYQGPNTLMKVINPIGEIIASRVVQNDENIIIQSAEISSIQIFAYDAKLKDLKILDLFQERLLNWSKIARISVADTINYSLHEAAKRFNFNQTINKEEWEQFVEAAQMAVESTPLEDKNLDEPSKWKAFELLMSIRWEHAVLFGYGFFDGPHEAIPENDWIDQNLIFKNVPTTAVVYRVRDEKTKNLSCMAICPPHIVGALQPPTNLVYVDPKVRLTYADDHEDNEISKFEANYKIHWSKPDPTALGAEIEEEIRTASSGTDSLNYICRTQQANDLPLEGVTERIQDVPFHDSQLRCKARAIDGWDRVSNYSAWTNWTSLELEHFPAPPNFINAQWINGNATLIRQKGDTTFPKWQPDPVIESDPSAKVSIYRRKLGQTGFPAREKFQIQDPIHVKDNQYKAQVIGASNLEKYIGGYLIKSPFKEQIKDINGNILYFDISPGGDGTSVCDDIYLQQNPLHLDLWDKVAEFDANNLPNPVEFPDNIPDVGELGDTLSYHARVIYLGGRIGPPSNTVQAIRIPTAPNKPDPFTVEQIGVDYYNRTMIKIKFNQPVNSGKYTVWWARGESPDAEHFREKAVQGVLQEQAVYENQYLYDVLAIPLPQTVSRIITIGIQRVNDGGAQSDFKTLVVDLPPLLP